MESARFADLYKIDVFTIILHFLRFTHTSSYLNKAPRHDDASTLHNLMALGPVAPAQRAARRDRACGVV